MLDAYIGILAGASRRQLSEYGRRNRDCAFVCKIRGRNDTCMDFFIIPEDQDKVLDEMIHVVGE